MVRTWTANAWLTGRPADVMHRLTDPESIARWSPVDFEVDQLDDERLSAGTRCRVWGALAGRRLEFDVIVDEASDHCLALMAHGPVTFAVDYRVAPVDCGTEVQASITVSSGGMLGRMFGHATGALLSAGALDLALARLDADIALASGDSYSAA